MSGISRRTSIEDLAATYPGVVTLMVRHGLPCLVCGEPVWGTFEEVARNNGKTDEEIEQLVATTNKPLVNHS